MARIIFVQTIKRPLFSMFYLCGALKQFGHEYHVLVSNKTAEIIKSIDENKPDLVGFSVYSGDHLPVLNVIREIKSNLKTTTILGGPHPTFCPDCINEYGVDIICRGEGEFPLIELMNRIDKGENYENVENLWIKQSSGSIIKNDVRSLVDPLDLLPMPDFTVYQKYPIIMDQLQPLTFPIRGCPFSCAYCYNSKYRSLCKGKGKYVRYFSPDRTIAEVKECMSVFPDAKLVDFCGDCFGTDYAWLEELMSKYVKEIGLPFSCLYRPELIDEKKALLLKEGGCHYVAFGIESGSEAIRKSILKRNYSNQDVVTAVAILKKYGIKFRTFNMVGLPGETRDDIWKTIDLNIEIKPDMPWCSIYTPYPGTDLAELASKMNLLPLNYNMDSLPAYFHLDSVLNTPDKDYIVNAHHLFQYIVALPKLKPFWKLIMKLPRNKLIELAFRAIYLYYRIKSDRPRNLFKYVYSMVVSTSRG